MPILSRDLDGDHVASRAESDYPVLVGYSTELDDVARVRMVRRRRYGSLCDTAENLAVYEVVPDANVPKTTPLSVRALSVASEDSSVVSSGGMRTVSDVSMTVEPWLFVSRATHLYSAPGSTSVSPTLKPSPPISPDEENSLRQSAPDDTKLSPLCSYLCITHPVMPRFLWETQGNNTMIVEDISRTEVHRRVVRG